MTKVIEFSNGQEQCPKCGRDSVIKIKIIDLRINFRIWFITIDKKLDLTIKYCPKCGYLDHNEVFKG